MFKLEHYTIIIGPYVVYGLCKRPGIWVKYWTLSKV